MKNEALKQAGTLAAWLTANDITINDVTVTIQLKNNDLYKIMNDGSIMKINDDGSKAFTNAAEAISSFESSKKPTKDSLFVVKIQSKNRG